MAAVFMEISGDQVWRRKLLKGAEAAGNLKPGLEWVTEDMFNVIHTTFQSQGRRGGGSWPALDPAYVERKVKQGKDPRILISSGALMRSVTEWNDENQYLEITNDHIILESELPYAARQQYGGKGIPARAYIKFTRTDKARWAQILQDEIGRAIVRG